MVPTIKDVQANRGRGRRVGLILPGMAKRTLGGVLLALATALAAVLALPVAPAQAATYSVEVSARNVVQETWECPCVRASVNLEVTASALSGYIYHDYDVTVRDPAGGVRAHWIGRRFINEHMSEPLALTPGSDMYGTYALDATVSFYGASDTLLETKSDASSFTFSGPPPPPAPSVYASQITADVAGVAWAKRARRFGATLQSEQRAPQPGEIGVPATFRLLVGKKVVDEGAMTWRQVATLSAKLPRKKRTRKRLVRIEINGQVVFSRYCKVKGKKRR